MSSKKPDTTQTTTAYVAPTATERRPGRLCLRVDNGKPQTISLEQPLIKVGRSRVADLTIRDGSISKVHFSLRLREDGVVVEDLGSKNGIWYADRRVQR